MPPNNTSSLVHPQIWVPEGSMRSGSGEKSLSLYSCSDERPSWAGQNFPKARNAETASPLTSPSDGIDAEWRSFPSPMTIWARNQRTWTSHPSPTHCANYFTTLTLSFFICKWVWSQGYPCPSWALSDFKVQCNILSSVSKEGSVQKLPLWWALASAIRHSQSAHLWSSAHLTHTHTAHSSSSCGEIWCLLT